MGVIKTLWASVQANPRFMQSLHKWLTIIWFLAAFPIMWFWSENLRFLVFVSVYAVVTGHWSSYQACKVEVRQEEIATEQGIEVPNGEGPEKSDDA